MASTSSSLTLAMYDYNSPAMMKSSNSQSPAMSKASRKEKDESIYLGQRKNIFGKRSI
jgi:hypothetical protein